MAFLPDPAVERTHNSRGRFTGGSVASLDELWAVFVQTLCLGSPDNTPIFGNGIAKAWACGARPFEVISGTPHSRFGARMTFGMPPDKQSFAAKFGLPDHPLGFPEWIGLRTSESGRLVVKMYHLLDSLPPLPVSDSVRRNLHPIMVSLHEGSREVYARFTALCEWRDFVMACLGGLGRSDFSEGNYQPYPKAAENSFAVSFRFNDESLASVTLFAYQRALPDDETTRAAWSRDMSPPEHQMYELAYAAVRSLGQRRFGSWHAMLGWTVESDGQTHRAASLRVPLLRRS